MNHSPRKPMSIRRLLVTCGGIALLLGIVLVAAGAWVPQRTILWLGVVALATGAFWLICARFASDEPVHAVAFRRYVREFFPAMTAYIVLLFVSLSLLKHVHAVPLRVLIALLPVVPTVFVVRAMVRLVMASDELEQRLQLEAICIASLSVGLLSFAAAFLRSAGLLPVENAMMLVLPALFAAYGIASWWVHRRYRGE